MTLARALRPIALLWLAACVQLLALCPRAAAQVVVLRIDPAAEPMSQQLEAALSSFGLVPDPGYFDEAQRRGLDPTSDEALTQLTPPAGAQLAVVPRGDDGNSVQIEFRDGRTGAGLGSADVPLLNGTLGPAGQQRLAAEVNARLRGAQPGGPGRGPSSSGEDEDDGDGAPGGDDALEGGDEPGLLLRAFAGVGFGTRTLEWPAAGETLAVETGAFLAVELGTSFAIAFSDDVSFGPELIYQTSLSPKLKETHVGGATDEIAVRAHRFEALLALDLRFDGKDSVGISPAIGFGVRSLHPEVHHLLTPSYSLTGPVARVALRIPFGSSVALRIAPQLQLVSVGDALEELGVDGSGLAFGGDAALELGVSDAVALELSYREAHAVMASSAGDDSTDVERFSTVRAVWTP